MKRNHQTDDSSTKRSKNDTNFTKEIILRNDDDPHVYLNMKPPLDGEYVKIGDYIYKAKSFDQSWASDEIDSSKTDNIVAITLSQYNDISDFIYNDRVVVSSFHEDISEVEKISVNLYCDTNFKLYCTHDEITNHLTSLLDEHIVCVGQKINTYFCGIAINVEISRIDATTIGKVSSCNTEVGLIHFDSNILICNKTSTLENRAVRIYITQCIDVNMDTDYRNVSRFPLIADHKILENCVRRAFSNNFNDNSSVNYVYDNYQFTFNIKVPSENKQTKYRNTYRFKLNDNTTMPIVSMTENVVVTKDTRVMSKVSFTVLPIAGQKYDPNDYILRVDSIVEYVKKNVKKLTNKQAFKYSIHSKEVALKVNLVKPYVGADITYIIDPDTTKIVIETDRKSRFILINNAKPYEIEKIVFKLKKEELSDIFQMLFGGGGDDSSKLEVFDQKKLEKLVRDVFPKKTALKHQMKITYHGIECLIKVKEIVFADKSIVASKKYRTYGNITLNTEIVFVPPRNNKTITINNTVKKEIMDNPIQELEKHVGGLTDELKTVVRSICLSRGKLKTEFNHRGLKAVKGIIFHGPPGTGKTALSRNLGKILGCEGERFRLMAGSEIFNKWVGQSEANVRGIFKPAKEAWKKYGVDAPTYMVVIDEIDALLPVRSGSSGSPVRDSVVNQFLAEMDGLEQFYNLICIGITNRLELIDAAAIRAGRFGVHIKIDLPDRKGRMKIFEIHTKKLKEINRLENIDFHQLCEMTDKFSGADIENVVEKASELSLERLNDMDIIKKVDVVDEKILSEYGKVTENDFLNAIREIKDSTKIKDSPPPGLYM